MVVWGIGAEDPLEALVAFEAQMGLSFPILFDEGGSVHAQYDVGPAATNTIYPQDWIIGVDGEVVYVSNSYDPVEMIAILEAELAKGGD